MRTSLLMSAALVGTLSLSSIAGAQTVTNGNFETDANLFTAFPGYVGAPNPSQIPAFPGVGGLRGINGPSIGAGQPFAPTTPNGTNFAFLQGDGTSISQSIDGFNLGSSYTLSYDDATRSGNDGGVLTTMIGTSTNVTTPTNAQFTTESLSFVATATTLTLSFTNTSGPGDITVDVDNVSITPVPEPATLGLLGLSGLGLLARRRRA